MNIRAKLGLLKRREKKIDGTRKRFPVYTEVRSQSLTGVYSYKDFLIDMIRHYTIKQRVYHPYIPTLIVEYVPIYSWSSPLIPLEYYEQRDEKEEDIMKVNLSHCDTIASNGFQKFGAVMGTKLDPRLDHVIDVQLLNGVEFGVGICDESQLKQNTRRDFMCVEGGYGYYNYKTKSARMKPKYPPGLYYQVQNCRKIRNETEICQPGDILSLVIQRENVNSPGGGINVRSRFGSARDVTFNPMNNLKASSKYTLSFYKNGEDMGFHLRNLEGPFHLCLNYYFVDSKIRLLSDYNFRRKYIQWACQHKRKLVRPRMANNPSESSRSLLLRSATKCFRLSASLRSRAPYN